MRIVLIFLMLFSLSFQAQEAKKRKDKELVHANKLYTQEKYTDAESVFRISKSKNVSGSKSSYNLGNTIYKQNLKNEAKYAYLRALEKAETKAEKHQIYHNLGNVFMGEKQYAEAVEAYKNALRNNPTDEETRYNYALAKDMLDKNPQDPDDGEGNNDKEKEQNQNEKEGNDEQDQKQDSGDKEENNQNEKKEQNNQDNQEQNENQAQPQPQPSGITKQQLQNLLDAVNNEEKKVQDKINQEKIIGIPKQTEKDW